MASSSGNVGCGGGGGPAAATTTTGETCDFDRFLTHSATQGRNAPGNASVDRYDFFPWRPDVTRWAQPCQGRDQQIADAAAAAAEAAEAADAEAEVEAAAAAVKVAIARKIGGGGGATRGAGGATTAPETAYWAQSKAEGDEIYDRVRASMQAYQDASDERESLAARIAALTTTMQTSRGKATALSTLLSFTFTLHRKGVADFVEQNTAADLPVVVATGPSDWQAHLDNPGSRPSAVAVRRISNSVPKEYQAAARRAEAVNADLPTG
jgi:hypothetical protein